MPTTVIIIGAGVSGLSVGCYLHMNGFDTEIFEMHNLPGGLCTAWKRGGYTFDGCIHWLMGSGPSANMHRMWRELGAVQGRRFVEWDEFARVRTRSGETLTVYTDPEKLEREMLRLAPEDGKLIRQLCGTIRRISTLDMPVTTEKIGPFERLRFLLPWLFLGPAINSWGSLNIETFCSRLKSRTLAEAIALMYGGEGSVPDFPVVGLIMMLPSCTRRAAATPSAGHRSSPEPSSSATSAWAAGSAMTHGWTGSWWRRTGP